MVDEIIKHQVVCSQCQCLVPEDWMTKEDWALLATKPETKD